MLMDDKNKQLLYWAVLALGKECAAKFLAYKMNWFVDSLYFFLQRS